MYERALISATVGQMHCFKSVTSDLTHGMCFNQSNAFTAARSVYAPVTKYSGVSQTASARVKHASTFLTFHFTMVLSRVFLIAFLIVAAGAGRSKQGGNKGGKQGGKSQKL